MAFYCENCGVELFAGQKFCRACGQPTGVLSDDQAPTQKMPPQPDAWGASRANTAPPSSPDTSPVYTPPGYYQPTVPPMPQHAAPPYAPPPRSRSPWGWILGLGSLLLICFMIVAVIVGIRMARVRGRIPGAGVPAPPDAPAPPGAAAQAGESVLNETGAQDVVVNDRETSIKRTFPLNSGASFSVTNLNGDVTVESWDRQQAEVRVIKRGGSVEDRRAAEVRFSTAGGKLALRTAPTSGFGSSIEVRYEIKLPRDLGRVDISSANSEIKISDIHSPSIKVNTANGGIRMTDIEGVITANTAQGSIDLIDIIGGASAKTMSGNIKAVFQGVLDSTAMEFGSVSGNIEVRFNSDLNAELDARTVSGGINIDDEFGIAVKKEMVGQKANGTIGSGGQPLRLKTVSGNIKVGKD